MRIFTPLKGVIAPTRIVCIQLWCDVIVSNPGKYSIYAKSTVDVYNNNFVNIKNDLSMLHGGVLEILPIMPALCSMLRNVLKFMPA